MKTEILESLKSRLNPKNEDEENLLDDIIEDAFQLFLSLRYPTSPYPVDDEDNPIIEPRFKRWIIRCVIEMVSKEGGEGQVAHIELNIHRTYNSGTVSKELMGEITPMCGIAR